MSFLSLSLTSLAIGWIWDICIFFPSIASEYFPFSLCTLLPISFSLCLPRFVCESIEYVSAFCGFPKIFKFFFAFPLFDPHQNRIWARKENDRVLRSQNGKFHLLILFLLKNLLYLPLMLPPPPPPLGSVRGPVKSFAKLMPVKFKICLSMPQYFLPFSHCLYCNFGMFFLFSFFSFSGRQTLLSYQTVHPQTQHGTTKSMRQKI